MSDEVCQTCFGKGKLDVWAHTMQVDCWVCKPIRSMSDARQTAVDIAAATSCPNKEQRWLVSAINDMLTAALAEKERENEELRKALEPDWSSEPPKKQGWYWHWNGDSDSAALPTSVLFSGTSGKCFVSAGQLGIKHAIDCDQYGGLWMPLRLNQLPPSRRTAQAKA